MAVSINLLPQERQAKISDKRRRNLAIGLAVVINAGVLGLMIVLFVISQAQGLAISRLQSDIDAKVTQFQDDTEAKDVLTVQSNLAALPALYQQRQLLSKLHAIVEQVSTTDLVITQFASSNGSLEISGSTRNKRLITKLVRAMEAHNKGGSFINVELGPVTQDVSTDRENFNLSATVVGDVTAVRDSQ